MTDTGRLIAFTDHAIERFGERFPDHSLVDSFLRARHVTKAFTETLRCHSDFDTAYFDQTAGAIFICRTPADAAADADAVCVTVIRAKNSGEIAK